MNRIGTIVNMRLGGSYNFPKPTTQIVKDRAQFAEHIKKISANEPKYRKNIVPEAYNQPVNIENAYLNPFTNSQLIEKTERLGKSLSDGAVFTFDLETLGSLVGDPNASDEINKMNKDIATLTEVSLVGQRYRNGQEIAFDNDDILADDTIFSTTRERDTYLTYQKQIIGRGDRTRLDNSNLSRMAGYQVEGAFDSEGRAVKWGEGEIFNTSESVENGIEQLSTIKNGDISKFRVGSQGYINKLNELKHKMLLIADEENNTILTYNGEAFDMPKLFQHMRDAGIPLSADEEAHIMKAHVDFQKVAQTSSKSDILDLQTQIKSNGGVAGFSLTNTDMVRAANQYMDNIGKQGNIILSNAHVATDDAVASGKAAAALYPLVRENVDKLVAARTSKGQVNRIFMNSSLSAGSNDLFYTQGNGMGGSYNSTILQSGMTYDVEYYSQGIYSKPVVKFTQVGDEGNSATWLLANEEDLQEKLFNSGVASPTEMSIHNINRQNALAVTDKGGDVIRGFFRTNSKGGYNDFKKYLDAYEAVRQGGSLKVQDLQTLLNNSDVSTLLPMLKSNESIRNFKAIYQELDNNYKYYKELDNIVKATVDPSTIKAAPEYMDRALNNARTLALNTADKIIAREVATNFANNITGTSHQVGNIHQLDRYRNSLDIIGFGGGEYRTLRTGNKAKLVSDLGRTVRYHKANNRAVGANELVRQGYISEIMGDLRNRGIITQNDVDKISGITATHSQLTQLATAIMAGKNSSIGARMPGESGTAYAQRMSDYVTRANVKPVIATNNRINAQATLNSQYMETKQGQAFFSNVISKVRDNMPSVMTINKNLDQDSINAIGKELRGLGWSDDNISNFTENVLQNKALYKFTNQNGEVVQGGMSYLTFDDGENSYLAITSADRINGLTDNIRNGKTRADLEDSAMFVRLPRITDNNGTKTMQYSDSHAGILTQDVRMNRKYDMTTGETNIVFDVNDSMDQYIDKVSHKLMYAKEQAELGNYRASNTTLNTAMSGIHEDKSKVAVSSRTLKQPDGSYTVTKTLGWNAADASTGHTVGTSELLYALPFIMDDKTSDFYQEFVDAMGGGEKAESFLGKINDQLNGIRGRRIDFSSEREFTTKGQLWFQSNISEIAGRIASNQHIANNATPAFMAAMGEIMNTGTAGYYVKDTDSVRGFFNKRANDYYVAGSRLSVASRPTMQQKMAGVNVYADDAANNLNRMYGTNVNTNLGDVGILHGSSWTTEGFRNDVQDKLADGQLAEFSMKTKLLGTNEYIDKVNQLREIKAGSNDYVAIAKLVSQNNPNIKINERTLKKIAHRIGMSGTNYEDSGLISPLVGAMMNPQTITTRTADTRSGNFKVGQVLKAGDILSDGSDGGRVIRHKGKDAIITDVGNGRLTIQQTGNYNAQKFLVGGEKAEFSSPVVDSYEEAVIADAMIQHMTGGARATFNPNLGKHQAFNSMFTAYTNAIGNSITNDNELQLVNAALNKNVKAFNMRYEKNRYGRYQLVESARRDISENTLGGLGNMLNDLNGIGGDFEKNYQSAMSDIKNNLAYMDFTKAQDNTITNAQMGEQTNVGASTSPRSQAVMGAFMGDHNMGDLTRYLEYDKNGETVSKWNDLEIADMEEMLADPGTLNDLKQGQNIMYALGLNNQYGVDTSNLNIVDYDINKAIFGGGALRAEALPGIFKAKLDDGTAVNAYKLDLNGVQLENYLVNQIMKENAGKDIEYARQILKNKKIGFGNVKSIYIPALDPNRLDDKYILTETQKRANDVIRTYYHLTNPGLNDDDIVETSQNFQTAYNKYIEALQYDLTDGGGFVKKSLKGKKLFSERYKFNSIAAPVLNAAGDGFLDKSADKYFKMAQKQQGGDGYAQFAVINPIDIFGGTSDLKGSYTKLGKELISTNHNTSGEFLGMVKKHFGSVAGIGNVTDLQTARRILKRAGKGGAINNLYEAIGKDYVQNIGFDMHTMRDPAQREGSHNIVRVYGSEDVHSGAGYSDPVTASDMKGDSDGDEVNLINRSFKKAGRRGWTLRDENDKEMIAMRKIKNDQKGTHWGRLQDMNNDMKQTLGLDYQAYLQYIAEKNPDMLVNSDSFSVDKNQILLTKLTKNSIGQVSNPNLYLRAASKTYFKSRPNTESNARMRHNLTVMQEHFEQNLIDLKSARTDEEASAFLGVSLMFRQSMDDMGNVNNEDTRRAAATFLYNAIARTKGLYTEDDIDNASDIVLGYKYRNGEAQESIVAQAIDRVMSGKAFRSSKHNQATVEEMVQDMITVLDDEEARNAFFDPFTRQTNIKNVGGAGLSSVEILNRVMRGEGVNRSSGNKLYDLMYGGNVLTDAFQLQGNEMKVGEYIASAAGSESLAGGIYRIQRVGPNVDGQYEVELKNDVGDISVITGNNAADLSEKLKEFAGMRMGGGKGFRNNYKTLKTAVSTAMYNSYTSKLKKMGSSNFYQERNRIAAITGKMSIHDKAMLDIMNSEQGLIIGDIYEYADTLTDQGIITGDERNTFISEMIADMNTGIKVRGDVKKATVTKVLGTESAKKAGTVAANVEGALVDSLIQKSIAGRINTTGSVFDDIKFRNDLNEKFNSFMGEYGAFSTDNYTSEQLSDAKDMYINTYIDIVNKAGNDKQAAAEQILQRDNVDIAAEMVTEMNTNTKVRAEKVMQGVADDIAARIGESATRYFSNNTENGILAAGAIIGGTIWAANALGNRKMMKGPKAQYKEGFDGGKSYSREERGGAPRTSDYGGNGSYGTNISIHARTAGHHDSSYQHNLKTSLGFAGNTSFNINHRDSRQPIRNDDINSYLKNNIY